MRHCTHVRAAAIVLAAAVIWVIPVVASAQAFKTATATEVFDPMNIFGNGPVGEIVAPGTVTCPGAQPTGNPMQPCPPGSRIKLRGFTSRARFVSDSPLLAGWLQAEVNANFDDAGAGRAWGTFRLELDAGGVCEGSYTNDRIKVEGLNVWIGRALWVGRGTSGTVDGLHLRFTEVASTFMLMPVAWVAAADAVVFGHRGLHR